MRNRWAALAALFVLLFMPGCAGNGGSGVRVALLDDVADWTAHPADGVSLELSGRDGALLLDFDFEGGGYAIARRDVDLTLPENYAFRFLLRGDAPTNHLEFKLVDDSGENVWWHVKREVAWPGEWQPVTIKKRHISFAWGPGGGGEPGHVAALEFAVTAGEGGRGRVAIKDLELVSLPVQEGPPPPIRGRASSWQPGHPAGAVLDPDAAVAWRPAADDPEPWLELDLGRAREFGGLQLSWEEGRAAADYRIEFSLDGERWWTPRRVRGGNGGQDHLFLPEAEARLVRILPEVPAGGQLGLSQVRLLPLEWSDRRETFFARLASAARRGLFPRGFLDEPTLWTVVGVDGDEREGLLGQYGAVEVGPGEFSLEPFLQRDGRLLTWKDLRPDWRLAEGWLPLPEVALDGDACRLTVAAAGVGEPGASAQLVTYTVENSGAQPDSLTLFLALRPFQVNPPVQFLNVRGGVAAVPSLARAGDRLLVDGRPRVLLLDEPHVFGASTLDGGEVVVDHLAHGKLPAATAVADPQGLASGALGYALKLEPGESRQVSVLLPLHEAFLDSLATGDWSSAEVLRQQALNDWRGKLSGVTITGPPAAREALETARAQLGWILTNRAGAGFQPGTRSYARSWIRDGALTGAALLRLGHDRPVQRFLRWFAPHQYASGKIPCVVDHRGADPVPEHDSTGQFIYLVAEYLRYTGDQELGREMWPRVLAGVDYLESLLEQRRTAEYRAPERAEFYGILPPSISHEGYSAKPMHSYWDDFFALRGLKDAAWLATVLDADQGPRLRAVRDRFAADLAASLAAAMARHGIDYLPGCADLGDFDPTSTTVALDPAAAAQLVPAGSLERTFERYWEFFAARRDGEPWRAFTPYEVRNIGAFVRLGWRDRAQELLHFFLEHRIPAGWRQWPEVVASDTTRAWFVGDMPHTWVGSDFVRSILDMLVFVEEDHLVLAAGVPADWLAEGGLQVADLPTPWGPVAYRLWRQDGENHLHMAADSALPPGGLRVAAPDLAGDVLVNGEPAFRDAQGRVMVQELPAEVSW